MNGETDQDIEQFPVVKRQIRYEEPPDLIFFDVDEDTEEADFIRVDDLFADEQEGYQKLSGQLSFTLFPRRQGELIGSALSKKIHRSMIFSALRLEHPLEKVRIRPNFAQWQVNLSAEDDAERIAREFRDDLEDLLRNVKKLKGDERFWSDNCFVSPIEREIPDEMIIRVAFSYQEQGAGNDGPEIRGRGSDSYRNDVDFAQ